MSDLLIYQLILCICLLVSLFLFPNASHLGAEQGTTIFFDIILPYLLPYIFLTTWLFSLLNYWQLAPRTSFLITYISSAVGGYPVGAIAALALYEQQLVSKKEVQWLLPFLHSPNPFFVINFVGGDLLHNKLLMVTYLTLHHIVCSIGVFVIYKRRTKRKDSVHSPTTLSLQSIIEKTTSTMLTIAITIIFFSSISYIAIELLNKHVPLFILVSSIGALELTNGLQFAGSILYGTPLIVYVIFLLSSQSISVHLQVATVVAYKRLSLLPYFFIRIIYTAVFSLIFLLII